MNGSEDELVLVSDAKFLSKQGIKRALWHYEGDRHAAIGTAWENIPRGTRWIRERPEAKRA